jgi:hypothetical protein
MSIDDFDACTPDEIAAIFSKWNEANDYAMRDQWERARIMATIIVQPHLSKKVTPKQLLPLPWDGRTNKAKAPALSKQEQLRRFRDIKRRLSGESG